MCKYKAAASPFRGSIGFGYESNCGRNDSNTLFRSRRQEQVATNNQNAIKSGTVMMMISRDDEPNNDTK